MVVVFAHGLATVVSADRIYVMDHGRVAEVGAHEDLVRKGGIYARLHQFQFGTHAA